MCNTNRNITWSTILLALVAAVVPTLLYAFGISTLVFPLTIVGLALAVIGLFATGYFTACNSVGERQSIITCENQCACYSSCICRHAVDLLVYAALLFFVSFVSIATITTAVFGLAVAIVALVSFLSFALIITVIRLVYCYISRRCNN